MNTKILLVSIRDAFLTSDRVMPPLGIMSLHAFMQHHDIPADMTNDFFAVKNLHQYSHVGISCMTPQSEQAARILWHIKVNYPDITVIIGGPHTQHYLNECRKLPYDHIVIGDGEWPLLNIMMGYIPYVVVKDVNAAVDDLPAPTRDPEFLNQYNYEVEGLKATTILTAKGCPNSCAFCPDADTKVRFFSLDSMVEQVVQCKSLGYQVVVFYDDLFAISLAHVKRVTQAIKPLDIKFRCLGHAKNMTLEMATLLADAGCIDIGFGAESGSQKILDTVNKRTTVEQNRHFVKVCNQAGMKVKAHLMLGLPGESPETVEDTRKFIEFLLASDPRNEFDLPIYYPYKGTHIRDNMYLYDINIDTSASVGFYKGIDGVSEITVSTSAMTRQDLLTAQRELLEYRR